MSSPFPDIIQSEVARPGTPGQSADEIRLDNIEARLDSLESRGVRPVVASNYYGPLTTLEGWAVTTPFTFTQNKLYASPWINTQSKEFDICGINVTTAVASAQILMGLYASGTDNLPSTLIDVLGWVDAGTTGWRSFSPLNSVIDPGAYWIAGACSHAGVAVSTINGAANLGMTAYLGRALPGSFDFPMISFHRTALLAGGFVTLPNPFGTGTSEVYCPAFQLGAV